MAITTIKDITEAISLVTRATRALLDSEAIQKYEGSSSDKELLRAIESVRFAGGRFVANEKGGEIIIEINEPEDSVTEYRLSPRLIGRIKDKSCLAGKFVGWSLWKYQYAIESLLSFALRKYGETAVQAVNAKADQLSKEEKEQYKTVASLAVY